MIMVYQTGVAMLLTMRADCIGSEAHLKGEKPRRILGQVPDERWSGCTGAAVRLIQSPDTDQ